MDNKKINVECTACEYQNECFKEGYILNVTKESDDAPRYIRNLGSYCKKYDDIAGYSEDYTYGYLKGHKDGAEIGYKNGADDLLQVVRKMLLTHSDGGFSLEELSDFKGSAMTSYDLFKYLTPEQLIDRFKKWEENKKQPVRGDYVSYTCCDEKHTGILLCELETEYLVLFENEACPHRLSKHTNDLTKLNKHIDLDGLFDGVKNHD